MICDEGIIVDVEFAIISLPVIELNLATKSHYEEALGVLAETG